VNRSVVWRKQSQLCHGLDELKLPYILAIRSHHGVWLPQAQAVTQAPWQECKRTLSNGSTETRYLARVIYGKRHRKQYWLLTPDTDPWTDNSTSFVMVCAPAITLQAMGDQYGFRTWIKYGLKQAKDALGWADFRVTRYEQIEKWWELVMSAFFRVSLFDEYLHPSTGARVEPATHLFIRLE